MLVRGVIAEDRIETIQKSQTFPTTGDRGAQNLAPELQSHSALFDFAWEGTSRREGGERNGDAWFIPITAQEHRRVIRKLDAANDVSAACQ